MSAIIQGHDIMSYSKESITGEENTSVPQLTASSSAQDPVQNVFFRTSDKGKKVFSYNRLEPEHRKTSVCSM